MEELYKLGFDDIIINNMLEINAEIKDLTNKEVKEKVELLNYFKCNDKHKNNIIESNPLYLNRLTTDIIKLATKLTELGFTNLNILFDSNPYILNLDDFEIQNFINREINAGKILEDVVDELEANPYLFNEI